MFSRLALVVPVLMLSFPATAQQPVVWPWQAMQVWAVPAQGAAMPFPTPFWLWVPRPPPVQPQAAPEGTPNTAPEAATESAINAAPEAPARTNPVAEVAAPGADTPRPAPVVSVIPEAAMPPALAPVAERPLPAPVPVVSAVEAAGAKVVTPPDLVRKAPVAKQKPKTTVRTTGKARKLCFKDGKLDVCP